MRLRTSQKNKRATDSVECSNRLKNTAETIIDEKEYNDNNLFFYCKYFDTKSTSLKKLPPNHKDLSSKHLTCIKKL